MDLDQLHTFLEIVRLKSFSKAAQTCFRTQPAISAQVRQLEQELNTTLFERLGTRISLTMAGKIFAEYAEQILNLRRQAQDSINELEKVPRGELVIAANEATCIYVLAEVFPPYKEIFPNRPMLGDPCCRAGRLGQADRGNAGCGNLERLHAFARVDERKRQNAASQRAAGNQIRAAAGARAMATQSAQAAWL